MQKKDDGRNPTGIVRTKAQLEESERQGFWDHAIRYGLQYYASGRFATAHRFNPVSANILHHAVELLLKACLAYDDPLARIREYKKYPKQGGYGHDLELLWNDFKRRQATPAPSEFDEIIIALHKFEEIRYPEELVRKGATILIGPFEDPEPIKTNGKASKNR